MITNKIYAYSAFNSSDPSWLLTILFTHFFLHILAGIRRGGREGEGGGEYEIKQRHQMRKRTNNGKNTKLSYCRLICTTPTTHGCEYDEHKLM